MIISRSLLDDAYFRLRLRWKDEIWARDLVHDSAKQKPMHRTSLLAFPFFLIRLFLVMISLQRKKYLKYPIGSGGQVNGILWITDNYSRLSLRRTPLERQCVCLRACLHEGGGPQVGEVTCGGLPQLTCKRDHIKMRDCMDRRVTPPKRVTSPTWGSPPPCKQALREFSL